MKCPHCGSPKTQVLATRRMRDNEQIRRRRVCVRCGGRFTSHERVEDRAEAQRIAAAVEYLAGLADKNLPFSSG